MNVLYYDGYNNEEVEAFLENTDWMPCFHRELERIVLHHKITKEIQHGCSCYYIVIWGEHVLLMNKQVYDYIEEETI